MVEYEYMVIPVGGLSTAAANVAGQLNRLGAEGWRIAAALSSNGDTRELVLMRERIPVEVPQRTPSTALMVMPAQAYGTG